MHTEKLRRFRFAVVSKIFLLLGFAFFFLRAIVTGDVDLYVHPRVIPYLMFAAAAMTVIAVLLAFSLRKPGRAERAGPLIFFAVPLILALALSPKPLDASTGTAGDVQLTDGAAFSDTAASVPTETGTAPDSESTAPADGAAQDTASPETGITLQDGVLVIDSGNFYPAICALYADLKQYQGTPVETVGFVFRDESFVENEFVPARLLMVCCAADMQTVGLLCRYDGTAQLAADSWVKVTGTLEAVEYNGETIPCIAAQTVEPVDQPADAYVYPY